MTTPNTKAPFPAAGRPLTRDVIEALPRLRLGKDSPLKADLARFDWDLEPGCPKRALVIKDVKKKTPSSAMGTGATPSGGRRACTAAWRG